MKTITLTAALALATALTFSCTSNVEMPPHPDDFVGTGGSSSSGTDNTLLGGPVSYYGKLKASGNKLVGSKTGATVQMRGVSLFWSNTGWGGDKFFTANAVNAMVDDWKAEIIRVPIGYSEDGGYSTDASNLARVKTAIDAAIAKDVYVIIDWHSHNAHNELAAATTFFEEMAKTYGANNHVIFEIYNEPNCSDGSNNLGCTKTTWTQIKTYANSIISTIRQHSDNLILVGTPSWNQDVDVAASSQVSDSKSNIAYVFHFYAYTHPLTYFQSSINAVLNAGYPVFVSEYGTTHADGGGGNNYNTHDATSANAWHAYMDSKYISSCAWSVNDKYEGSAFFGTSSTTRFNMSSWTSTSSMTASGQYIYNKLNAYANSAAWRGNGGATSSSSSTGGGRTTYCDFGPITQFGGGCFEMMDENDCDLEWGEVVDSCPSYSYCLDYSDYSCISMTKISSCSNWAYGSYEISNSCPSGWTIY
ncbi:MAG: glycoside hydrolase family 5 protein [Fibromonadaceae bacterium]|jgi:endoglucanase|nr:glycoside hydrolase family 5 protein [Fibromonadaceae bacterium]